MSIFYKGNRITMTYHQIVRQSESIFCSQLDSESHYLPDIVPNYIIRVLEVIK